MNKIYTSYVGGNKQAGYAYGAVSERLDAQPSQTELVEFGFGYTRL